VTLWNISDKFKRRRKGTE